MDKAIIIGAGTYGQAYKEYMKSRYDIVGYIDDNKELHGRHVLGVKVLGNMDYLIDSVSRSVAVFAPIGDNDVRVRLLQKAADNGFITPCFVHPQAIVHDSAEMGAAIYILPGANIMPFAVLGDYAMVSAGVNIAHHTVAEEGCFFSQGSNIGASIYIGTKAYFGISSVAMTGVKRIGANCLIGAGAVVIRDVDPNAIMAGVPAKLIRYKE